MGRSSIAIRTVLVSAALGVAAFAYWAIVPRQRPEISAQLGDITKLQRDTVIDLGDIAQFAWTDVYIVPPYVSEVTAEKRMGVSWRGPWSAISVRDTLALLVFVDSQRITGVVEHPRNLGDFATIPDIQRFHRSDARFAVTRADSSGPVFQPISVRVPARSDSLGRR